MGLMPHAGTLKYEDRDADRHRVFFGAAISYHGALIAYWHDRDDRSVQYRSLHEWAAGLADELEQAGA